MDEKGLEIIASCAKEVAKEAYFDGGRPIVKPAGELAGLIPRTIKAILLSLEEWVLLREHKLAEITKLLELKLENVNPELIGIPEPHIAVPALQYISYCMDNEELRNMYANLLASSMNKSIKDGVHPSFVEIIKQLCPDEAKILRELYKAKNLIPVISVLYADEKNGYIIITKNFSLLGELSNCEYPTETEKYFDNLERLGLIESAEGLSSLQRKELYIPLKNHSFIIKKMEIPELYRNAGYTKTKIEESYVSITAFGISFCNICLRDI